MEQKRFLEIKYLSKAVLQIQSESLCFHNHFHKASLFGCLAKVLAGIVYLLFTFSAFPNNSSDPGVLPRSAGTSASGIRRVGCRFDIG